MKVVVVAVGKIKDGGLRALMDDYLARVRRYVACEEVEVKDDAALEKGIPREAFLVACEVHGRAMTSEEFARNLERWGSRGKGVVALLVGGAEGIPPHVSARAGETLSLSKMTLPHRLARVVLAEQIYRAFTILRNEPYAAK